MGTELLTESGNPSRYAKLLSVLDAGAQLREWLASSRFEAGAKTDYDANGKIVKSAKEKVVEYIDGLDVAGEVKDAFYLCWYAKSELSKTPWHGGFFKWPSFSNDAWASFPKIELPRY